jgi:hypothetical protein
MRVTWSGRGQETEARQDRNKTESTTHNYLPLVVSEAETWKLLEEALPHNEHALTVAIHPAYYSNPNARARPHPDTAVPFPDAT